MKKQRKGNGMKFRFMLLFWLSLISFEMADAQTFERSKSESRSFKVYSETSLEISNKYGNIHLFTWEKDSVKINIEVDVKANKESRADKIFEYIDFDFTHSRYYIVVNTLLKNNQGSFWNEVSDLANTIFSGNNRVQINYSVYLPDNMELKLENKFGNIYLTDYKGKITIKVSNGDLKANDLIAESTINISFGSASINSFARGKIQASYAEVDLDTAHDLDLESKSSTLNIKQADRVKINSRRDKFYFDEISSLAGKASFSYINLKSFKSSMDLITDYGEINLGYVATDFRVIDIQSNYTDINLGVSEKMACSLDVMHTEATGIYFPDNFKDLKNEALDTKADRYKTSGTIGNYASGDGKIHIGMKSGKFVIKYALDSSR